MGEPTRPGAGIRYANGLRFNAIFPAAMQEAGAGDLVPFDRVRIVLHHTDGTVALDTTIVFPADSAQLSLSLSVRLAAGAPASGEPMTLLLAYVNAAGDTVFKGGPTPVTASVLLPGQTQTPVAVTIVYTGAGANAAAVRISPRAVTVNAGDPFSFTAVAQDATGATIANTPIYWKSLDTTRALITQFASGNGTARNSRGSARIVAKLLTLQEDTVVVNVQPVPTAVVAVSGNNQTGFIGKPLPQALAQPLVVKVTAADGLGVAGAVVSFAVATGGGSVTPVTATTDTSGRAQTNWTIGTSAVSQTATATVGTITGSPVTFTATGQPTVATKLVVTTAPAAGANISAGASIPVVITAQDVDGDPVAAFTGSVTLSLATSPASGVLAGTKVANAVGGVATFSVSIGKPGTGYVIGAAATSLTSATTAAFNIVSGALGILTLVSGGNQTASAGSTLSPVTVLVTDSSGNAKPGVAVNFAATAGGGSVVPATINTDTSGQAVVAWTLGAAVGTQTLGVSSTGLTSLSVSATATAVVKTLVITQQPGGSQTAGVPVTPALVAELRDVNNAKFTSFNGSVSIAIGANPGGATLGGTLTVNAVSGVATFSNFMLDKAGTGYTIVVSSSGATSATSSAFNVAASNALVTTVVAPHVDTLTSIGDTRTPVATGRNAANGVVAGTWTWLSRDPTVVTVNATSALVTGIANGNTWVVATEAAGTKDSVNYVVQQRLATINVNPSARSLYTGGLFTFTAQAVDGRGNAMASQPTLAWSSTVPSVATINAGTGAATAVSIGSTQIKATSGTTVGVSNLTVLTPITRIDVTYDSVGATAPDNFTMPSLGLQRMYRATARDTLLNVMSGITFTWASTNPSVAAIDSTTTTQARATAAANGVTSIQATAQGVTGSATLNVAQVLATIDLSPASATIAVSGSTSLIARGKDANGRFIAGGTFSFASSVPTVATVNAGTGTVTGVNQGTTNVTATSGTTTSNVSVITVNNTSAPAVISFGRDTIGIGRGTTLSVPILLSKPNGTTVKVNLAAADTNAFWSTTFVNIPAGQTAVNATLTGRNAGTTTVTATDGSGTGYATASAVVAVQAKLNMTSSSYALTVNDQLSTQVLLSDPSPAGGTYVTFTFGTAGTVSVSPDPAFIPAGQLAADVVVSGIGAGNTTLVPTATGVTGTSASVSVAAANLNLYYRTLLLGSGQFEPTQGFVEVPNYLHNPLTVTLTSTDTSVVTIPPSVTIPANGYYSYYSYAAKAIGAAKVIASATGWKPDTLTIISTTPRVRVLGGTTLNTTSATSTVTLYSADSTYVVHSRTNSLAVQLSSSDTTVMKVVDTLVTIPAGTYYNNAARVTPGTAGGTAWIRATASGHLADSTMYTVVGPKLTLSFSTNLLGVGQEEPNYYVQIPNPIATPVVVTLTSSDSTKAATAQTATIPAGTYYAYFTMRGKAPGTVTFVATATGYSPDTATTIVTTPRVKLTGGSTLYNYATTTINVYTEDSLFSAHNRTTPLTVTLSSSDTTILKVDTIATIAAGTYYSATSLVITAVNPGTAKIYATAPGHMPDSVTWTVQPAKLSLSLGAFVIGARQHQLANAFYVQTPSNRPVAVPVTLTQKHASVVALSATTVTILANSYYQYFTLGALVAGKDTIIASATGYVSDTAFVTVSTPELLVYGMPGTATTTSPPSTLTVYVADSTGSTHYASDTIVVHAVSSDSNVIRPTQPYFRIIKDGYYAQPTVTFLAPGTASITYSDSAGSGYQSATTNTVTVTGPSFAIAGGNGMLGMRQQTSPGAYYVYVPNNPSAPLTVTLVSTDTRVATVPATVTIPSNSYYAYFTITAQDTLGTIQIQATATGYSAASVNMQVTAPKVVMSTSSQLNTTSPKSNITLYMADALGNIHYPTEDVTLTLASSDNTVAAIDSNTVTIKAGTYYHNTATWRPGNVGTVQLSATDTRAAFYKYGTATQTVAVVTPSAALSFSNLALGLGQYTDEYASVPDYTTSPLTVPLAHATKPTTTTPSSVTIPSGSYYQTFRVTGASSGSDTITASPPGHKPAQGTVNVTAGRIDPIVGWPASIAAGDSVFVTLYARDLNQGTHYVAGAEVFTLAPNGNLQFKSGGSTSSVLTTVTIPADMQYVQFWVKGVSAGSGSATITNANYTTYNNTVNVTP